MQLSGPGVLALPDDVRGAIYLLQRTVELGVRFFDTPNACVARTVNQLIVRALSPFGDDMIIGNKVGAARGAQEQWLSDSRPATIRTRVEEALLSVDLSAAVGRQRRPGQHGNVTRAARAIGVSAVTSDVLARAQRVTPIAAVQNQYNPLGAGYGRLRRRANRDRVRPQAGPGRVPQPWLSCGCRLLVAEQLAGRTRQPARESLVDHCTHTTQHRAQLIAPRTTATSGTLRFTAGTRSKDVRILRGG